MTHILKLGLSKGDLEARWGKRLYLHKELEQDCWKFMNDCLKLIIILVCSSLRMLPLALPMQSMLQLPRIGNAVDKLNNLSTHICVMLNWKGFLSVSMPAMLAFH